MRVILLSLQWRSSTRSSVGPRADGGSTDPFIRNRMEETQILRREKNYGRGTPTFPALRPRVLTPRDHFVHRGGERAQIMHEIDQTFNRVQ